MYVEIHATSEPLVKKSGKTTSVIAKNFDIKMVTTAPKHLDSPPWHIEIEASEWIELSNGSISGNIKEMYRMLELQLTPNDLSKIMNYALTKGLLSITPITDQIP